MRRTRAGNRCATASTPDSKPAACATPPAAPPSGPPPENLRRRPLMPAATRHNRRSRTSRANRCQPAEPFRRGSRRSSLYCSPTFGEDGAYMADNANMDLPRFRGVRLMLSS
jgi:hypothetical protein